MPPIISIVGKSGSGKTKIVEALIKNFKQRGYRVGTIKHHSHGDFEIDIPGKDSWRHARAGSDLVVISSPVKLAMIKKMEKEASLDQIVNELMQEVDVVLTDGYNRERKPRVIIAQSKGDLELFSRDCEVIAVVCDGGIETKIPIFSFKEISNLTSLIENKFLKAQSLNR
jgi:molybdopterin-guanine dinucleotide biosynthesis protein B